MPSIKFNEQQLFVLLQSSERLRKVALPQSDINSLINYAALLALRLRLGTTRPKMVGLIGCTGTGKSTLFNSITNRHASITGWKAHNTRGPILFSSPEFQRSIEALETELGTIILPNFDRHYLTNTQEESTLGSNDKLYWMINDNHHLSSVVLIDLPDINTTKSRVDRLIALEVLPWLDQVIFVVDEESLYHRDYVEAVELSKSLQQTRLTVINNRGKDRIILDHPDFQESKRFFGVERLHVLPIIESGPVFTTEAEFIELKQDLLHHALAPKEPIALQLSPIARSLMLECKQRKEDFQSVETEVNDRTKDYIAQQKPIGFDKILHDDVLNTLEHLGLKRFTVTNIYQLFKNIKNTGSFKRSFSLAFGNKRGDTLDHLLHIDNNKLKEQISNRLQDIGEEIQKTVRKNPHHEKLLEIAPELRHISLRMDNDLTQEIAIIIESFENRCREVLQSDTLESSLKNDPLVALGVLIVFVTDFFTIYGFGSFILMPTLMKYLPIGKFEQIKRDFQRESSQLIQKKVRQQINSLQDIHSQYWLRETEPAYQALKSLAQ